MKDYVRPDRESLICKFTGIKKPGGRLIANFVSAHWEIHSDGNLSDWNVDRVPVSELQKRFRILGKAGVEPDETQKALDALQELGL